MHVLFFVKISLVIYFLRTFAMSFHIYLHAHVRKVHAEVCGEVPLNRSFIAGGGGVRKGEHMKGVYLRMVLRHSEI